MFVKDTVFILGAGASRHYGYPTGLELVELVLHTAMEVVRVLREQSKQAPYKLPDVIAPPGLRVEDFDSRAILKPWEEGMDRFRTVARRLADARPLVIDYFLGRNADIADIGRFLIAWVILECEHLEKRGGEKEWHRFVVSQLLNGCHDSSQLMQNRVHFVTFNYDTSIDRLVRQSLVANSAIKTEHVDQFLEKRIEHLYGMIRAPYAGFERMDFSLFSTSKRTSFDSRLDLLNRISQASKGIRVIDPTDKNNDEAFNRAAALIANAKVVYILGYGFDDNNTERLGLIERLRAPYSKSVMFTNFEDANRINKKASRLFFGHPYAFAPGGKPIEQGVNLYYEKSTGDVYEALSRDFDSLEEVET